MKEENKKEDPDTLSKGMSEVISLILYIAVALVITFLLIKYVGQRTVVDGQSMEPTLYNNDNLIVYKISYRFKDPERFDIIVFPYQYKDDTYYIKRIIGLPGETVQIDTEGNIYIDGEILEESYGKEIIKDPVLAAQPITLGDDEYFVLGDNRNHSGDSRFADVGNVRRSQIIGRAFFRMWPISSMGLIKHQ